MCCTTNPLVLRITCHPGMPWVRLGARNESWAGYMHGISLNPTSYVSGSSFCTHNVFRYKVKHIRPSLMTLKFIYALHTPTDIVKQSCLVKMIQ